MARATLDDPVERNPITYSWRWEAPGKHLAAQLDLRVVDGIVAEVLRGLGAVPKRGVEVGGILVGAVELASPATVVIRRFEPVAIEYLHGPQYRLSERDLKAFKATLDRLHAQPPDLRPVGFYRSSTDELFSLSPDDHRILAEFFPDSQDLVLLIHPAVLKAPSAVLMARDNGSFPPVTPADVFAFRRRELTGGASEKPQGQWNRHANREEAPSPPEFTIPVPEPATPEMVDSPPAPMLMEPEPPRRSKVRLAVAVLLLTLLALGATAGDWYARRHTPAVSAATLLAQDPYAIGLSAEQRDDYVLLHWNRNARVLSAGERGILTVTENDKSKTIDLDAAQLRNGIVLYRHIAPEIRFRLEVFTAENRAVVETLVWHPKGI